MQYLKQLLVKVSCFIHIQEPTTKITIKGSTLFMEAIVGEETFFPKLCDITVRWKPMRHIFRVNNNEKHAHFKR